MKARVVQNKRTRRGMIEDISRDNAITLREALVEASVRYAKSAREAEHAAQELMVGSSVSPRTTEAAALHRDEAARFRAAQYRVEELRELVDELLADPRLP